MFAEIGHQIRKIAYFHWSSTSCPEIFFLFLWVYVSFYKKHPESEVTVSFVLRILKKYSISKIITANW
jgi:hypothetical protein